MDCVDYKVLLSKYILLVGYAEGISFISESFKPNNLFTDNEWEELKRLDKEDAKWPIL